MKVLMLFLPFLFAFASHNLQSMEGNPRQILQRSSDMTTFTPPAEISFQSTQIPNTRLTDIEAGLAAIRKLEAFYRLSRTEQHAQTTTLQSAQSELDTILFNLGHWELAWSGCDNYTSRVKQVLNEERAKINK